jgi:hypothetical protein
MTLSENIKKPTKFFIWGKPLLLSERNLKNLSIFVAFYRKI